MRIKLKNATEFRNDDLRDLFRRSLRAVGFPSNGKWPLEVEISHTRYRGVSGVAAIGRSRVNPGLWVKVRIPKREKWTEDTFRRVVAVTVHECMHLVGSEHKDMTEAQYECTLPLPEWAEGLQLRPKERKPELPPAERLAASRALSRKRVDQRLAEAETRALYAQKGLTDAKRRATRAETLLKKWQRRKASLERAIGAEP